MSDRQNRRDNWTRRSRRAAGWRTWLAAISMLAAAGGIAHAQGDPEEEKPAAVAPEATAAPDETTAAPDEATEAPDEATEAPDEAKPTPMPEAAPEEGGARSESKFGGLVGAGKATFNFIFETRVQLTVFDTDSIDPLLAEPPGRSVLTARSVTLGAVGSLGKEFAYTFLFGLDGNPLNDADAARIITGFGEYRYRPWLKLRAGLMVMPFGWETSRFFPTSRTIERSVAMTAINPGRDLGIMAHGDIKGFGNYKFGVLTGANASVAPDPENPLDYMGRLEYVANKNLKLGVTAQVGTQDFRLGGAGARFLTRAQADVIFISAIQGFRQRYGVDIRYDTDKLFLRTEARYESAERKEILSPNGEENEGGTIDASDLHRWGGYAEAGYFVTGNAKTKGLEAVARTEYFAAEAANSDEPGDYQPIELLVYTLGASYWFQPTVRFSVNGMLVDLQRFPTNERPDLTPQTFLENDKHWVVLSELHLFLR